MLILSPTTMSDERNGKVPRYMSHLAHLCFTARCKQTIRAYLSTFAAAKFDHKITPKRCSTYVIIDKEFIYKISCLEAVNLLPLMRPTEHPIQAQV